MKLVLTLTKVYLQRLRKDMCETLERLDMALLP